MSWLKKIFGSQSSQETQVYYEKDTQTVTQKQEEESKITESNFEEVQIDDSQPSNEATQSSQESWFSSWSGLSQPFTPKGEKRDFSSDDEEEDRWWKSFCSESKKKLNYRSQEIVAQNQQRMKIKMMTMTKTKMKTTQRLVFT